MKKFVFFLMLLSCTTFSFAQTKLYFSPDYKLPKNKALQDHLHSNSSGHYMYFAEQSGGPLKAYVGEKITFTLEKYDRAFKREFSKEFISSKKGVKSSGMKYFKNKFAWLLYEKDKKTKTLKYYLTPIDLKGESGSPKTIAKFKYDNRDDIPSTNWSVSKDTSNILFSGLFDTNERDENFEAYLSVIDENFEKKWSKKIRLPYSQKRVNLLSSEISNDGTAYFVVKVYDDNRTKESKKKKSGGKKAPAYDIYIYAMDGKMDKPKKYELNLKDSFAKGLSLRVDDSNNLSCVGFFGDSKSGPVQGVFYLQLSKENGGVVFSNKRRFTPKELLSFGDKNVSKDKKSKDSGLDPTFKFKNVNILENGEIYATAEEAYSYMTSYRDSQGNVTYRRVYVNNSIISIHIDKDGKVQNVGIIPKRQSGSSREFFSYSLLKGDDQLYFMYNEDEDNLRKNITDPDKIKPISSAKDCVAVLTTIDSNNKISRKSLFSRSDSKTLLRPSYSRQISDTELFFFTSKYKLLGKTDFKFGIVSLE